AERDRMRRRPRDRTGPLLDGQMLAAVVAGGMTLAALVAGAYLLALPSLGVTGARTLALVCWLVGHVALGFAMVWERRPLVFSDLRSNPAIAASAIAARAGALAVLPVPRTAGLSLRGS